MHRFSFVVTAILGLLGVMLIAAAADDTDRAAGVLFALTGCIGAAATAASSRKTRDK